MRISNGIAFVALLAFLEGCAHLRTDANRDLTLSDLISRRIAVGPVQEARTTGRETLRNRLVALSTDDIQREIAAGVSDIHRGSKILRVTGRPDFDRVLAAAHGAGGELLMMPRIEQLVIDDLGRNGVEAVAGVVDTALFPITIGEALVTGGERGGLGHRYLPIQDVMVSMTLTVDFHRVSDGRHLGRRLFRRVCTSMTNKSHIDGSRFDPGDDWIELGREQARFLIREFGRDTAKHEVIDLMDRMDAF